MKTSVHIVSGRGATEELVTDAKDIVIRVPYPANQVLAKARSASGFTLAKFVDVVRRGYKRAYARKTTLRRQYHGIGDLFLEDISETAPGQFAISIGT